MEQPGVVAGNFAPSSSLIFLSIFVHILDAIRPITPIWASVERSLPAESRRCQFWSKVITSEVARKAKARHRWLRAAQESMV